MVTLAYLPYHSLLHILVEIRKEKNRTLHYRHALSTILINCGCLQCRLGFHLTAWRTRPSRFPRVACAPLTFAGVQIWQMQSRRQHHVVSFTGVASPSACVPRLWMCLVAIPHCRMATPSYGWLCATRSAPTAAGKVSPWPYLGAPISSFPGPHPHIDCKALGTRCR